MLRLVVLVAGVAAVLRDFLASRVSPHTWKGTGRALPQVDVRVDAALAQLAAPGSSAALVVVRHLSHDLRVEEADEGGELFRQH